MDLETENRIAALLMKEAAELRRQAQSEGALAYLHQPTARSRPNSRFLTATVRGVQQANRAVEVSEMWRLRGKQLELDNRIRGARNESSSGRGSKDIPKSHGSRNRSYKDVPESHRSRSRSRSYSEEEETSASASLSSRKRNIQDLDPMDDEGLRDDEVEQFLHSRMKRGRGAVGSRMDETGPYLPACPDSDMNASESADVEVKKPRLLLGPKKPYSSKSSASSDDESQSRRDRKKKKKAKAEPSKRHSKKQKKDRKHKSKDKKDKKMKDKICKHHK